MFRLLNVMLGLFYDRRYLRGRFFEKTRGGYLWAVRGILWQRVFGFNRKARYPVSPFNTVLTPANLVFHPDDLNNLQGSGKYFQNSGASITIGRGSYIANNVGLVTQNHDPIDPDAHMKGRPIVIGERCWIGMNAVVMPGVVLGNGTVVGAGAVVTTSFPEGGLVVAGNPARVIKQVGG